MEQVQRLIEEFITACMRLQESEEAGDYKTTNLQYDKLKKIRANLRTIGKHAFEEIIPLISNENIYVRYNAAFSIIPIEPEKARNTLNEIANSRGIIAFTSKMTLQEWVNGNLKFD